MKIEDAKPIFVFTADTELKFLKACSAWAFPINFTLAKTGLRIGELVHLLIEDVDLGDMLRTTGDIPGARAGLTEAARLDPRWKGMLAALPRVPVAPQPRPVDPDRR